MEESDVDGTRQKTGTVYPSGDTRPGPSKILVGEKRPSPSEGGRGGGGEAGADARRKAPRRSSGDALGKGPPGRPGSTSGGATGDQPAPPPSKLTFSIDNANAVREHTVICNFSGKVFPLYRGDFMEVLEYGGLQYACQGCPSGVGSFTAWWWPGKVFE